MKSSAASPARSIIRVHSLWLTRQRNRTRWTLLLLVAAAVSLLVAGGVCRADDVKPMPLKASPALEEFQKGTFALAEDHVAEAQTHFQKSLQLDPKLVGAMLGMAEVDIRKGNAEGADEYLQKASVLDPNNASVLTVRGHYLFFRKQYQAAEKLFRTAIEIDPKAERPHYEVGDLYLLGFHQPQRAIVAYREALAIDPKDWRVQYSLANALAEVGQLDEAQSQLEECVHLQPSNVAIVTALGDFYLRRGELEQAQRAFAKAIDINPRFAPARMAQGDVWVAKKDLDQAMAVYQAAMPFVANPATALIKIGMIHEMKGQWSDAEQAYRKVLVTDPKSALAANNLAWVLNEHQNKPTEALTWAEKAATLSPKDANFQDTLGWILRANDNPGRSLQVLKKANALAAERNPQILYHLGVAYQDDKHLQAAINALSKSLELSEKYDGAKDAQARLDMLRSSH